MNKKKLLIESSKAIAGISTSLFFMYGFYYGLWVILSELPDYGFLDGEYKCSILIYLGYEYIKPVVQLIDPELISNCLSGNIMACVFISRDIAEISFFAALFNYSFLIFSKRIQKLSTFWKQKC